MGERAYTLRNLRARYRDTHSPAELGDFSGGHRRDSGMLLVEVLLELSVLDLRVIHFGYGLEGTLRMVLIVNIQVRVIVSLLGIPSSDDPIHHFLW